MDAMGVLDDLGFGLRLGLGAGHGGGGEGDHRHREKHSFLHESLLGRESRPF
jgi:hypothetical protein